jgi:hypothetical protein
MFVFAFDDADLPPAGTVVPRQLHPQGHRGDEQ